jgi:hypothetical protein
MVAGPDGDAWDFSDQIRVLTSAVAIGDLDANIEPGDTLNEHTQIKRRSLVEWLRNEGYADLAGNLQSQRNFAAASPLSPAKPVTGIDSKVIIEKFKLEGNWGTRLTHIDKHSYLASPVLAQRGSRGKSVHLWNPAHFAMMLMKRESKNHKAMHTIVENYFPDWLEEFQDISGWNDV